MVNIETQYRVARVDGKEQDKARYVVLDMVNDPHARVALVEYAFSIREEQPELAIELFLTLDDIEEKVEVSRKLRPRKLSEETGE